MLHLVILVGVVVVFYRWNKYMIGVEAREIEMQSQDDLWSDVYEEILKSEMD